MGSEEEYIKISLMVCISQHQENQVNEMDGVYGTYGRQVRCTTFWWGT